MRLVCFCRRPQPRLLKLASVNIHTHLIPFVAWLVALFPFSPFSSAASEPDTPMLAFTAFALLCLFTSALWHTMAGCAHPKGMELCARIDYVGIGWYVCVSRTDRSRLTNVQVNQRICGYSRALRVPMRHSGARWLSLCVPGDGYFGEYPAVHGLVQRL